MFGGAALFLLRCFSTLLDGDGRVGFVSMVVGVIEDKRALVCVCMCERSGGAGGRRSGA